MGHPLFAAGGEREEATDAGLAYIASDPDAPLWEPRGGFNLFDSGGVVSCQGCGAGGADESILQTTSLGMNILGFGHQQDGGNRVADDFVVPSGHNWSIDTFTFFAYQTGSDNNSTMTEVTLRIWDGVPSAPGSNVVAGDPMTDVLGATAWSGVYRVTEETSGVATDRPIMADRADLATTLPSGQYWLDWATGGTLASGPWAPPITIPGEDTTGDGLQSTDLGVTYTPIIDTDGSNTPQGLPFIVNGNTTGPTLRTSGTCPGPVTVTYAGGTPGGNAIVVRSTEQGAFTVPGGGCAGSLLGLNSPAVVTNVPLDGSGGFSRTVNLSPNLCGVYIEAVDLSSCDASTVAQIP